MDGINTLLEHWEPLWLFLVLVIEAIFGLYSCVILTIEYFYDAKIVEEKKRKTTTKNKVKVVIDSDGNATIEQAPKGLDISIEHKGEK